MTESPSRLPPALVALIAVACGASVANVYYAQPLLELLAQAFGWAPGAAGVVVAATQLGCALALVFVVPLGDRLDRRRLLLAQSALLVAALAGVALARAPAVLLAGMVALGLLGTAMTQGLIAYAAALAAPAERGRVVGAAQSGVVVGLLLARTVAGLVAGASGWRAVYAVAAVAMGVLGLWLGWQLPRHAPARAAMPYGALLRSLAGLLLRDRVLQVRGMLGLLLFAVFNIFWAAMALALTAPPHRLGPQAIGAFGLVGVAGALAAARAGRWVDGGHAQRATAVALALLVAGWLPLAAMPWSLAALALGVLLLDMGAQALHVTNQALVLRAPAEAHGRLIAGYMLFYAVGSGVGGWAGTRAWAGGGWPAVCLLGAATSLAAVAFWAATKRWMNVIPRGVQCCSA